MSSPSDAEVIRRSLGEPGGARPRGPPLALPPADARGVALEPRCVCPKPSALCALEKWSYAISAILPQNTRSRRVAERSGARAEGQKDVGGLTWDRWVWPLATGGKTP